MTNQAARHPAFWLAVSLICVAAAAGLWFVNGPDPGDVAPGDPQVQEQNSDEPAVGAEEHIEADTEIILRTNYPLCEQLTEHRREPVEAELGKEREEFAALHSDWNLVRFGRDEVVLARTAQEQEDMCQELESYRTVILQDGRVVVLYGRRTPGAVEMLETDLLAEHLPSGDRERLQEGIVVNSDSAVWELMEGLRH